MILPPRWIAERFDKDRTRAIEAFLFCFSRKWRNATSELK